MNKDKITRYIIYLSGVVCLLLFIIVRTNLSRSMYYILMDNEYIESKNMNYGDLYYMNFLDNYKTGLKDVYVHKESNKYTNNADSADIIVFGDSFVNIDLIYAIADTLDRKIIYFRNYYPFQELRDKIHDKTRKRIIIYEIVERNILNYLSTEQNSNDFNEYHIAISTLYQRLFSKDAEQGYSFILQNSKLSGPMYKRIANYKFDYFGQISSLTPTYIREPKWLFYYQEINNENTSFYYNYSDDEIRDVVNNIEKLKNGLKEIYNADFVFVPVPNKYTMYHNLLNNDNYNNLLPVIAHNLSLKNIFNIDLYNEFKRADTILYHGTDTHWNKFGVQIAINKIYNYLRN